MSLTQTDLHPKFAYLGRQQLALYLGTISRSPSTCISILRAPHAAWQYPGYMQPILLPVAQRQLKRWT